MMAELLKRYYPKLVDINNYIPGCSLSNKIENWCTLNRKVLSKIDIKLNKDTINSIAQSQPGAIEKLLYEVRSKIVKDCNKSRSTLFKSYSDSGKEGKNQFSIIYSVSVVIISLNYFCRIQTSNGS